MTAVFPVHACYIKAPLPEGEGRIGSCDCPGYVGWFVTGFCQSPAGLVEQITDRRDGGIWVWSSASPASKSALAVTWHGGAGCVGL